MKAYEEIYHEDDYGDEETILYENPEINSKIIYKLKEGDIYKFIDEKMIKNKLWCKMEVNKNIIGWCNIEYDI